MKSSYHYLNSHRPRSLHTLPWNRAAGITARGFAPATALGLLLIGFTSTLAVEPLLVLQNAGEPLGISADGSRLFTIDRSRFYTWNRVSGGLLATLELPVDIPRKAWRRQ